MNSKCYQQIRVFYFNKTVLHLKMYAISVCTIQLATWFTLLEFRLKIVWLDIQMYHCINLSVATTAKPETNIKCQVVMSHWTQISILFFIIT